jgi:TFIIF-interacting CTD phosphatase-like protein
MNINIKNVIFDIDNTLVHSISDDTPIDRDVYNNLSYVKKNGMTVFFRPRLSEFLDVMFSKYNVSVWTAANKAYAEFICKMIMKNRKVDFVYSSEHCYLSNDNRGGGGIHRIIWI